VARSRLGIGNGSHSTSAEETGTAGTSTDPTRHAASTLFGSSRPVIRGLHTSTLQLNVGAFCVSGVIVRGSFGGV